MALTLVFSASLTAEEKLVVLEKYGPESEFSIGGIGKIVFNDGKMTVFANGGDEIAGFDLDGISKLLFSDRQGGLTEINPDGNLEFYTTGDAIGVKGLQHPANAYIVNMSGQVCLVVKNWNGTPEIDISTLPDGVYVLAVDNAAFKFTKH